MSSASIGSSYTVSTQQSNSHAIYYQKSSRVTQSEFALIELATNREYLVKQLERLVRDVKEQRLELIDSTLYNIFKLINSIRLTTIALIKASSVWQESFTSPIRTTIYECDYIIDRVIKHIDFINALSHLRKIFNFQFFRGNPLLLPFPSLVHSEPISVQASLYDELQKFANPNEEDVVFVYQFLINSLPESVYSEVLVPLEKWLREPWIPRLKRVKNGRVCFPSNKLTITSGAITTRSGYTSAAKSSVTRLTLPSLVTSASKEGTDVILNHEKQTIVTARSQLTTSRTNLEESDLLSKQSTLKKQKSTLTTATAFTTATGATSITAASSVPVQEKPLKRNPSNINSKTISSLSATDVSAALKKPVVPVLKHSKSTRSIASSKTTRSKGKNKKKTARISENQLYKSTENTLKVQLIDAPAEEQSEIDFREENQLTEEQKQELDMLENFCKDIELRFGMKDATDNRSRSPAIKAANGNSSDADSTHDDHRNIIYTAARKLIVEPSDDSTASLGAKDFVAVPLSAGSRGSSRDRRTASSFGWSPPNSGESRRGSVTSSRENNNLHSRTVSRSGRPGSKNNQSFSALNDNSSPLKLNITSKMLRHWAKHNQDVI